MNARMNLNVLVEETERARGDALASGGQGRPSAMTDAVLQSLRRTLAAVAEGYDPAELGVAGCFTCEVDDRLKHTLAFKGRALPVNGRYLEYLLSKAGVDLLPGQSILLDAELAREVIEDALNELDRDHERLARDRSELAASSARPGGQAALRAAGGEKVKAESLRILRRKVELLAARFAADDLKRREAPVLQDISAAS